MNESASSGIHMLGIYVDHIRYNFDSGEEDIKPSEVGSETPEITTVSEDIMEPSNVIDVEIGVEINNKDPFGLLSLSVKCNHPKDQPVGHNVEARLIAAYKKVSEKTSVPFDQFLATHAPAALFAFARELVFSITSRSPIQPILLDPVNMYRVLNEGMVKFRQSQEV